MSNKRPGRNDDEYLKSAWDWASTTAVEQEAGIRLVMTPTSRRGVWTLRVQACDVVDTRVVCVKLQHTIEFPGASHQTLAGAILAGLLHLERKLEEGTGTEQRPM